MEEKECYICYCKKATELPVEPNKQDALCYLIDCPRCGQYIIHKDLAKEIIRKDQEIDALYLKHFSMRWSSPLKHFLNSTSNTLDDFPGLKNTTNPQVKEFITICRRKADLSAFIQERQDREPPPKLNANFIDKDNADHLGKEFHNRPKITMPERADKLLTAFGNEAIDSNEVIIDKKYGSVGSAENDKPMDDPRWIAKAWALNQKAFNSVIDHLRTLKQIKILGSSNSDHKVRILPNGWQRLKELDKPEAKDQGFVAMWFDKKMDNLYDAAIAPAISAVGYNPLRIDRKHCVGERITHCIELEIKKSRFVVADFTGHRGGVYFEAGFARALGRPVFFTCREDHFEELHFDVKQFPIMKWNMTDLENKEGTREPQYVVSNTEKNMEDHKTRKLKCTLQEAIENTCGKGSFPDAN